MTLCVAWKTRNRISLASDSRVSFGSGIHADVGIKVLALDVCVQSASDEKTRATSVLYHHSWGLCFAGNFCAAYSVREFLSGFMANLQYAGDTANFNMDDLCSLILEFYKRTTIEIIRPLGEIGQFELVVTGFCPEKNKTRAFRFMYEWDDLGRLKAPQIKEILTDKPYYFFGTGISDAEQAYLGGKERLNDSRMLASIRHVIKSNTYHSVGGALQYGSFEGDNFIVYGIQETFVDNEGVLIIQSTYRGHTIQGQYNILTMGNFIGKIQYIVPF